MVQTQPDQFRSDVTRDQVTSDDSEVGDSNNNTNLLD